MLESYVLVVLVHALTYLACESAIQFGGGELGQMWAAIRTSDQFTIESERTSLLATVWKRLGAISLNRHFVSCKSELFARQQLHSRFTFWKKVEFLSSNYRVLSVNTLAELKQIIKDVSTSLMPHQLSV